MLLAVPLQAAAVDLLVSNLTDNPDPAVRGGTVVYSASVTNNTNDVAQNASVEFALDAQTSFVSVSSPACSYAAGPHRVTCNYATIRGDTAGPGSADIINVNVTVRSLASAGATISLSATVSTTDLDTNAGNNTLAQLTTIDNGADLSLLLSGSPASVAASGALVYTAALNNAGPNPAGQTTATFTLTPNVAYQSANGPGWSCSAAGQLVTCTRGAAPVGALPSITINTRVTGAVTGTITSSGVVSISGGATDFNGANNASLANTQVTSGTDLSVTKIASAGVMGSGQPVSFTLRPRNSGPFAASNVTVTDSMPAGFTNIGASGAGWTCGVAGQGVSCNRASYAVGATDNIVITANAPVVVAPTNLTNTTTISSDTADGSPSNNTGTVNVSIVPDGVDLSIAKSKTPNPVAQGGTMTSRIRVTNRGPRAAAAGAVQVVETLAAGETFAGASGANWSCGVPVGQNVTCTYGAGLTVGAVSSELVLTTTATVAGTLTNTACAVFNDAVLSDPNSANNCASASAESTPVADAVDLQLSKVADRAVLASNAPTVTYTLTVTNAGPGTATGVVMVDPIPGFIAGNTLVTASLTGGTSGATFSCTTGATVTCSQTGGSMAVGTTAIFTVAVNRPLRDSSTQAGNVWINNATVHSNDQGDLVPANNAASASVQVDRLADVTVTNTVNPGTVPAGTNATYVLTVNNRGPSRADGVVVEDVFVIPAGTMTFISATPSTGACAAYNAVTNTLTCNLGNMNSGATASITVVVRPDHMVAPPSPRDIQNIATVSTTTDESNTANNSAPSVLTVTQAAVDLLVNNTDNIDPLGFVPASASPVFPDNVITYRNVITNRGPSVATGLVLTYVMKPPAGKSTTFLGDKLDPTGQAYSNYCNNLGTQVTGPAQLTITCTFPSGQILMAGNATTDLYLDFRVDTVPNSGGDAYQSTVTIASNEPETLTANNTADQSTTIKVRTDLQLVKSARAYNGAADAATTVVQLRQPFYWVLTVTNNGPGDSNATSVTDTLPAGLTLYTGNALAPYNAAPYSTGPAWSTSNASPTSGSCTGTTTISCSVGLLENGKVATIRIPVVANSFAASVQNCASAATSEVDVNPANNSGCGTVTMQRSSIAGAVYVDANNDGAMAAGETGITGVSMRLNGTDIYGNAVSNLPATTNAAGAYLFNNLSPGTYTIAETQPTAFLDGKEAAGSSGGVATGVTGDTISTVNLAANTGAVNYLFGELAPATLSGFVFVDLNANALRDLTGVPATDESAGVTGIGLTLTGTDDIGPVNLTINSAANGAYSFATLRPGTYQVQEATMAGVTHTGMTIGSKGGNDGASVLAAGTAVVGATKRTVSNIALVPGDSATNYNFGESGQGLGGMVYVDTNNNGAHDAGEPGIAGVAITLSGNTLSGVSVCVAISPNPCTITTGADGVYGFVGLPASDAAGYSLTEQSQASLPLSAYGDGSETVGTVNGVATGTMSNDQFSGIVVGMGGFGSGYNFGENAASLGGKVYLDVDRSASFSAADLPLAGVQVRLSGTTAAGVDVCSVIASCITNSDAAGNFNFTGLPPSNGAGYALTEIQPADYAEGTNTPGTGTAGAGTASVVAGNSVIGSVVLLPGQRGINYLFGELRGSLAGFVYNDQNDNGLKDAGEAGIAGVVVTAIGPSGQAGQATTGADGRFLISNLPAGVYQLVETHPTGYTDGKETVGTIAGAPAANHGRADNAGYDASAANNTIASITLGAAQVGTNYLFGEHRGRIEGLVYVDANNNGTRDAGETPIAGVRVTLSGGACAPTACVTQSAADGSYGFDNIIPGRYTLVETQTDMDTGRYSDGKETAGAAGGTIDNSSFGTAPGLNTIGPFDVTDALLAANDGILGGYLFGERLRSGPATVGPIVSGYVWMDRPHTRVRPLEGPFEGVPGWTVTLLQNGNVICTVTSDANGFYQFDNLRCPGHQGGLPHGSGFEIRFSNAGNNMPNLPSSGGNAGQARAGAIGNIVIAPNAEITEQNLPLDPAGVVYDSVTRAPVAGAVIAIAGPAGFDPARHLLGGAAAASQTTGLDGMYQFYLMNDYPSGNYTLLINGTPNGYQPGASLKLPACASVLQVGASASPALVQRADNAPASNVPQHAPAACVGTGPSGADTTQYYLSFNVNANAAPIVNNHLPVDRTETAGLVLSKTGDKRQIEFGESLLYTLTLRQTAGSPVAQATIRDSLPAGFTLVPGTVKVNGVNVADPAPATGPVLAFQVGALATGRQAVLTYRLRAGVGSLQGDGVNRAIAYACDNVGGCTTPASFQPVAQAMASNQAAYKVRLTPGVFTEQACVAGKVFVDCNNNHVQDAEELGVPGVRLYLQDGTSFTTDVEGKYSYCGLNPTSHVLKADPRTLPRGSRLGTTSSRNLGDAGSLWLDAKNGELLRGDFAEASCSALVIEQVKARRAQGGVRSVHSETPSLPGLKFHSKAPAAPRQATDGANQPLVKPRQPAAGAAEGASRAQ